MILLPPINPRQETANITAFIRRTLKRTSFSRVIVALSGGVDSSATTLLCVRAVGAQHTLIAKLPYGKLNTRGSKDADRLIALAGIPRKNVFTVDIAPAVDALRVAPAKDQVRRGNLMARMRMIVLYDLVKANKAFVCGTENRSEHLLGYFTRFGDEASDLEPIRHLYKTQVRQLAAYLGVPADVITKPPTAGLWQNQTDEDELGFSYEDADPILYLHYEQKMYSEEIAKLVSEKTHTQSEKTLALVTKVLAHCQRNAFKHHLPYSLIKEDDSTA